MIRPFAIAALALLCWPTAAQAWLRMHYEDAQLVSRSEVIVVGRLDKDSITYVPHDIKGGGASWEYHATLIVSETLKGTLKEKQVAIVINYGLDPLIGGRSMKANKSAEFSAPGEHQPDQIDIFDTGNSSRGFGPALSHAEKDNLWFLRHLGGELGREAGKGEWGIVDPEDVQPLKLKDYFKGLLSADPEKELDRLMTDPDEAVCLRALRFLAARHRAKDAPRVAKLLAAPGEKVQIAAAEALAELGDLSAVPIFREALKSPSAEVRLKACCFLCRFGDTQSLPAIAKILPGLNPLQRSQLVGDLPRMESREVVDLLLDQLDEHVDANSNDRAYAYNASREAAAALRRLTGIEFPLDAIEGSLRWDAIKFLPDEVLLRRVMLDDIETLTEPTNYDARWNAYETLGRLANQHFGSYDVFHSENKDGGREKSQELWRTWARRSITLPRIDWVYEGFAKSGIDLPRPMDANGIDALIAVLEFYGDWSNRAAAPSRPNWSADGGWVKANFHRYNANWLLERFTGYKVGISPYHHDLRVSPEQNVMSQRWAAWWTDSRGKVKLLPGPQEKAVTAEMLGKVPTFHLPPPPLKLTIKPSKAVHIYKGKDPLTIQVEVKNVSSKDVAIERRPYSFDYSCSTGSGGRGGESRAGAFKEDFVTLKPGEAVRWEVTGVPSVDDVTPARSVERLRYMLTYQFAGSQFGLHAWRGKLISSEVDIEVRAAE